MPKPSLADYASKHKPPSRCFICNVPQREEVDAAYRNKLATSGVIFQWLRDECGYGDDLTLNRVLHHFKAKHHLR